MSSHQYYDEDGEDQQQESPNQMDDDNGENGEDDDQELNEEESKYSIPTPHIYLAINFYLPSLFSPFYSRISDNPAGK